MCVCVCTSEYVGVCKCMRGIKTVVSHAYVCITEATWADEDVPELVPLISNRDYLETQVCVCVYVCMV